jgi:hypothetical protein
MVIAGSLFASAAMKPVVAEGTIRYFPSGTIYDFRWQALELALAHVEPPESRTRLRPFEEDVTQNRGVMLLRSGAIDVIALGTSPERETDLRPIKIDILRGLIGFRLLIIRSKEQDRIARMDAETFRQSVTFGLNSQWSDLPIMKANGYLVTTSLSYENLFEMLTAGRFDAFPRGINEARRELEERKAAYPDLTVEKTKALFFPFPIYFWVRKNNEALAKKIEDGLNRALSDGSFEKLFRSYHAIDIADVRKERREIILLNNPLLPKDTPSTDTSWWWPESH